MCLNTIEIGKDCLYIFKKLSRHNSLPCIIITFVYFTFLTLSLCLVVGLLNVYLMSGKDKP